MKHYEFEWYGTDGKKVFAQVWQPDTGLDIKASLCLVHGMGEHSGRYQHLARFFAKHGFGVVAFDLRGHGQSEGKRGHVQAYDILSDQVERCLEEASKRFPGEPKFMYGHSLGGNIVIDYCLRRNPRVLGAVVSAPLLRTVEEIPPSKIWLARIMNVFYPSYGEDSKIDTDALSRDPKVGEDYIDDELVHGKVSARFILEVLRHADLSLYNAQHLRTHMLLMHGDKDQLTDHEASEEFAQKAAHHVMYREWRGFYHELHNEPEKEEVLQYVLDWMEKRMNSTISF